MDAAQSMVFFDRIEVLSVLAASGNVPEACPERPGASQGRSRSVGSALERSEASQDSLQDRSSGRQLRWQAVTGSCSGRQAAWQAGPGVSQLSKAGPRRGDTAIFLDRFILCNEYAQCSNSNALDIMHYT